MNVEGKSKDIGGTSAIALLLSLKLVLIFSDLLLQQGISGLIFDLIKSFKVVGNIIALREQLSNKGSGKEGVLGLINLQDIVKEQFLIFFIVSKR